MKRHIATGVLAILVWFSPFAAGVTIHSIPYRNGLVVLAPTEKEINDLVGVATGPGDRVRRASRRFGG